MFFADADEGYEKEILRLQHALENLSKKMDAVILDEMEQPHKEGLSAITDVKASSTSDRNDQVLKMTTKSVNDKVLQV